MTKSRSHFVFFAGLIVLVVGSFGFGQMMDKKDKKLLKTLPKTKRFVKDNVINSDKLPNIRVKVNSDFKYVGRFPFTIRSVAGGERLVFVDADRNKSVKRLFIAQFEGFFPHIDSQYRYNFDNAATISGYKFRHNPFAYSNKQSIEKNPKGEGSLTAIFLRGKGYQLEDELMMYRYLTVPPSDKKHELILYYLENLSTTGHSLSEIYKDGKVTEVWNGIWPALQKRSEKSFTVLKSK